MYRLLEIGEVIESGDEWYDASGEWRPNNVVGLTYVVDIPLRRLVKPAVTPAAEPVKSDPVVSAGDRVTVLSGPWAGCTGVVTGFETQVSLSQTSMRAMRDSVPVVRLDHVHVGGSRLVVKSGSLEKLAPVVPEVLFRDLSHGETIRQGDEIRLRGNTEWEPAGLAIGSKIGSNMNDGNLYLFRRPVRIQSPGWRYLDAGETVRAGDEIKARRETGWQLASLTVGKLLDENSGIGSYYAFRRKLPTISGG